MYILAHTYACMQTDTHSTQTHTHARAQTCTDTQAYASMLNAHTYFCTRQKTKTNLQLPFCLGGLNVQLCIRYLGTTV